MNFETLVRSAASPGASGAVTPSRPDPFVAPSIRAAEDVSDPRTLMISAPAAVGKSTLAKWLASETNAHFLDLGQIQVGSQGFIGDLAARGLQQAFNAGDLTVIIDALDEGLVRAGFDNYRAFFSDLVETVGAVKSGWKPDSTRLVLLGRDEYIELTGLILEEAGTEFDRLHLDYLDETRATELVLAYAKKNTTSFHEEPSRRAVESFFRAAARALEVDFAKLWSSPS